MPEQWCYRKKNYIWENFEIIIINPSAASPGDLKRILKKINTWMQYHFVHMSKNVTACSPQGNMDKFEEITKITFKLGIITLYGMSFPTTPRRTSCSLEDFILLIGQLFH